MRSTADYVTGLVLVIVQGVLWGICLANFVEDVISDEGFHGSAASLGVLTGLLITAAVRMARD